MNSRQASLPGCGRAEAVWTGHSAPGWQGLEATRIGRPWTTTSLTKVAVQILNLWQVPLLLTAAGGVKPGRLTGTSRPAETQCSPPAA